MRVTIGDLSRSYVESDRIPDEGDLADPVAKATKMATKMAAAGFKIVFTTIWRQLFGDITMWRLFGASYRIAAAAFQQASPETFEYQKKTRKKKDQKKKAPQKNQAMDDVGFVDEQIRLMQTPFSLGDAPVWDGHTDYPPVSDAALGSAIRKCSSCCSCCLSSVGSLKFVWGTVNMSLRNDILRLMGPGPRRALLSQLHGHLVSKKSVAAKQQDDFFAAFPSQWPDRANTTTAQRHDYETKRGQVFALTQVVFALSHTFSWVSC